MKTIRFLLSGIFLSLVFDAEAEKVLTIFWDRAQAQSAQFITYKMSRVTKGPECENQKCKAYKFAAGDVPVPTKIDWRIGGVNPTSTLCMSIHGKPVIAYLRNKNEVSICRFPDGSAILGWDMMKFFESKK